MKKLSLEDQIALVTGKGSWHTNDCQNALPSLLLSDGPHGLRIPINDTVNANNDSHPSTCYPTAGTSACSWDRELLSAIAASLATEARKAGVDVVLGPGINIKRSPFCGRNFEYFSEDPYLTGELAQSYVTALQSLSVGASLKHFAGNSQETHRQTANSQIDERALREIYLSAFEKVVTKAKPYTIMASYNRLNGEYACANPTLLTDILRKEWCYEGVVVSDWGACVDLAACLSAGMDLEMPDSLSIHSSQLKKALDEGTISQDVLIQATDRIQNLVDKCQNKTKNLPDISPQEVAYAAAVESAVLLKNDGFFPLAPCEVIVVGDLAQTMRYQGGGSSHINAPLVPTILDALTEHGYHIHYYKGYDSTTDKIDSEEEARVIRAQKQKLPVLFFGGLTEACEGEGYDRTTLKLPDNQVHLLQSLLQQKADVGFITFGGSPMDLTFCPQVHSILQMYLGGQSVASACMDLISGICNPCGKLAETYPLHAKDVPCHDSFATGSDDICYLESIFVGYRYYDTFHIPVQYCFGHGLSYTSFSYSNLRLNSDTDAENYDGTTSLRVTCSITNTGKVFGKEIVQLYVENPYENVLRAKKELRQFVKIALEPGQTKEVAFELDPRSFSVYDVSKKKFLPVSGNYLIRIAASINDIRQTLPITVCAKEAVNLPPLVDIPLSAEAFQKLYGRELSHFDKRRPGDFTTCDSLETLSKHSLLGKLFLFIAKRIVYGMCKGKSHDDPEVAMMIQGIREGTIDSVICQSEGAVPYKVATAIVLSANHHPFQAFHKLIRG